MELKFFDKLSQNLMELLNESSISAHIFNIILNFELKELVNNLETHLIETKAPWLKTHFSLGCHDFASLPESALVSPLKRDDLQMEENPTLPKNLEEWTMDNFLSLLVTELPPRINEPKESFSAIISEIHSAEISTWIDRNSTTYNSVNNPYKLN
ncbi:hypothetical protein Glove_318g32 [Diversispora epigaea]|uniref:Uncharacterized protein n=1 Tax=Diversispora epigaea TaxID=1348612 RepID=A0A397HQ47_9GLOM|nr:hypothetical protein Glove_318g32 [Diversispora epigaea]